MLAGVMCEADGKVGVPSRGVVWRLGRSDLQGAPGGGD